MKYFFTALSFLISIVTGLFPFYLSNIAQPEQFEELAASVRFESLNSDDKRFYCNIFYNLSGQNMISTRETFLSKILGDSFYSSNFLFTKYYEQDINGQKFYFVPVDSYFNKQFFDFRKNYDIDAVGGTIVSRKAFSLLNEMKEASNFAFQISSDLSNVFDSSNPFINGLPIIITNAKGMLKSDRLAFYITDSYWTFLSSMNYLLTYFYPQNYRNTYCSIEAYYLKNGKPCSFSNLKYDTLNQNQLKHKGNLTICIIISCAFILLFAANYMIIKKNMTCNPQKASLISYSLFSFSFFTILFSGSYLSHKGFPSGLCIFSNKGVTFSVLLFFIITSLFIVLFFNEFKKMAYISKNFDRMYLDI